MPPLKKNVTWAYFSVSAIPFCQEKINIHQVSFSTLQCHRRINAGLITRQHDKFSGTTLRSKPAKSFSTNARDEHGQHGSSWKQRYRHLEHITNTSCFYKLVIFICSISKPSTAVCAVRSASPSVSKPVLHGPNGCHGPLQNSHSCYTTLTRILSK